MNIYKSDSKSNFINSVIVFVSSKFKGNFDQVKILLPSGVLCSKMQEEFIKYHGCATLLPNIQTFSQLTAESHEAFRIPSSSFGILDPIEEKIILGDIISSYEGLDYNLINSIKFAPKLSHLFYELESNNIQMNDLDNIAGLQLAEHWENIHNFIKYSYQEWQKILQMRNVSSRAKHDQEMFAAEIDRLKKNAEESIVAAGIIGTNKQSTNFLKELAKLSGGHVILPPCPGVGIDSHHGLGGVECMGSNHAFFLINSFLREICEEGQVLHEVSAQNNILKEKNLLLDRFINGGDILSVISYLQQEIEQGSGDSAAEYCPIKYLKFDDVFDEADFVAYNCAKLRVESSDKSIVIVMPGDKNKKIYTYSLMKHDLAYNDLIGEDVTSNPAICLFMDLANFLCRHFNIKYFFKLLSNPEMFQDEQDIKNAVLMQNLILDKNRFVSSLEQVEELLSSIKSQDHIKLLAWFKEIKQLFERVQHDKFNKILQEIIVRLGQLNPNIWSKYEDLQIADTIAEIYGYDWQKSILKTEEFPDLFKAFISGGKLFSKKELSENHSITIANPSDISLINYDYVFLVDFSDGNYPPRKIESPWLNKQMQEELFLSFSTRGIVSNLYNLYLNLHSDNIFITWSQKQLGSSESLESSIANRLSLVAGDALIKEYIPVRDIDAKRGDNNCKEFAHSLDFPEQISASDIETLVRAPYNFYAKKILKLKALNTLDDYPTLAEFGNCFHKVAEIFTKDYYKYKNASFSVMKEAFDAIVSEVISYSKIPDVTKKIWQFKLNALAVDFIDFHHERQKNCSNILVEKKGIMQLAIAGREVRILAIADRIEIDKHNKNNCMIIDYKTGAIPAKSDVLSGLSPQLIVESIIMSEGGFDGAKRNVSSIIYIKIASSAPYINITEINLNREELLRHKEGLTCLLEHYITCGNYPLEPSNAAYDDYSYLRRHS